MPQHTPSNAAPAASRSPRIPRRPEPATRPRLWPVALLATAVVWACTACSSGDAAPAAPAATEVGVVTVQPTAMDIQTELAGRTVAAASAEVRPQVTGLVKARLFKEGSQVKAGQPLYQLDDATVRATLRSAQASVAKARATLAAAELKAQRMQALLDAEAGTRQDQEDAQAALLQAQADLQTALATQAAAQIDVDHSRIVAPISGRVDTSTVAPGALVTASQTTALTTVQQLDPIWVDIPQSSVEQLRLRRQIDSGALQGGEAEVTLLLEDGSTYAHRGRLQVQGVAVDSSTGAVTLRAQVPNPDGLLLPGMFVRARLAQARDPAALLVPQAAVQRNDKGEAVAWVVAADGKATQKRLQVVEGPRNQWRVLSGLSAGDRVVTEGSAKIRAGQLVHAVAAGAAASAPAASAPASAASAR